MCFDQKESFMSRLEVTVVVATALVVGSCQRFPDVGECGDLQRFAEN